MCEAFDAEDEGRNGAGVRLADGNGVEAEGV